MQQPPNQPNWQQPQYPGQQPSGPNWPPQQPGQLPPWEQPQYPNQQPQTGPWQQPQYPPYQQPGMPLQYPMPPQQPPRQPNFWTRKVGCMPMWVLILFIALFACAGINAAAKSGSNPTTATPVTQATQADQPTTVPTQEPTATPAPAWTATHTFSGHLSHKTPLFSVGKNWKLHWSCQGVNGGTGEIMTIAYGSNGKTLSGDSVDQTLSYDHCPVADAPTIGVSTVQKYGGSMYLDVFSTGDWTIEIQEFK